MVLQLQNFNFEYFSICSRLLKYIASYIKYSFIGVLCFKPSKLLTKVVCVAVVIPFTLMTVSNFFSGARCSIAFTGDTLKC